MKAPQIILSAWYALALLLAAHNHGESKSGTENFWYTFISFCIVVSLLLWGGFYG